MWTRDRAKVFHAQAQSYTPTGMGRGLRGAFLSTTHTGTGTGSGGGSGTTQYNKFEVAKVTVAVVGTIAAVSGSIAYGVHHLDQNMAATEIVRIEDKAATEIKLAAMEIKRVEGDRKLAEDNLKAEVARYKQDVVLAYSEDYKPYREAIRKNKSRGTWWSWLFG